LAHGTHGTSGMNKLKSCAANAANATCQGKNNLKQNTMPSLKEYKTAFSNLVAEIIIEDASSVDFIEFQSLIGMINTLIIDRKETELSMVLRLHFPEYYNDYKPFEVK